MDISWLEDFKALSEYKNFSRAADSRNITQPAFSRRIQALEAWVGLPLVDRRTHRLELTPAGERFLVVAEDVLRRMQQGRQEALDAASAASSLRFACTHVLSLSFFPSWLRRHEEIVGTRPVRLIADSMQGCERIMMQGQAHFAIGHHHPAAFNRMNSRDFVSMPLAEDLMVPVSVPDERGAPRFTCPGTPEAPTPYLGFSEESGLGRILASTLPITGNQAHLRPIFSSHLTIVLKQFASEGRGLAWSPLSLVQAELDTRALVLAADESWHVPVEIRLFRPRARQMEQAEEFWSRLRAQAGGDASGLHREVSA